MEKETLEEAAEKRIPTSTKVWDLTERRRSDFKAGANWQAERLYSEEEMLQAFEDGMNNVNLYDFHVTTKQWFEQFKKK